MRQRLIAVLARLTWITSLGNVQYSSMQQYTPFHNAVFFKKKASRKHIILILM